jgi:beta-mannosidase
MRSVAASGFRVNGHDVFARGANWIPADALAGRITPQAVRNLLQSAVDANMNMIRVWGGGRYEPDWFYDLCDELGLMVWQDFMFACNLYPCTDDFLGEVDQEVREVVARLHHHACLALWCGDNELIGALTWFPESRKDRDRYLVAYDRLNRTVETGLKSVDPGANWWPSSPSPGPLSFGDAWHDDSSGDMHSWAVWHEGRDFDHYRELTPRFASEFGFQSYPSMATIRRFAGEDDFNIASPVMESHQKNGGGNARIAETMFRSFRFPVDFESFVYVSQVQQAMAIRTAVTHWRTLKPHCMGTLYWQLNDSWPVCSWSSLNHGGSWKLLHHAARHFYAPVMATVVPQGESLHIKAVNDTRRPAQLHLEALALAMDGTTRPLAAQDCEIPTDRAVTALTLERAVLSPNEMLLLRWQDETGTTDNDLYTPQPFKAYDLPDPQVRIASTKNGETHTLTLDTDAPAFFVMVEADVPGRFSDNGVHLLPGEPVSITFTPDAPDRPIRFSHHDLFSATFSRAPHHHDLPERIVL